MNNLTAAPTTIEDITPAIVATFEIMLPECECNEDTLCESCSESMSAECVEWASDGEPTW